MGGAETRSVRACEAVDAIYRNERSLALKINVGQIVCDYFYFFPIAIFFVVVVVFMVINKI